MKIRLVKRWSGFPVGKVFEPADGMANLLIRNGSAERVETEEVEHATASPASERAIGKPQRTGRGK